MLKYSQHINEREMNMTENNTNRIRKFLLASQSIAIAGTVLLTMPSYAETSSTTELAEDNSTSVKSTSTRSISYQSEVLLDKSESDNRLKQADITTLPALVKEGYRDEAYTVYAARYVTSYTSAEVTIYDAVTELISDINDDGFYHRFAVTIDADTVYPEAYIFAELYLSYEGGPWNYFASSDSYHIYGDSDQDTFTIETELAEGFEPGYYDIRIELYDADTGYRILTYGPYDDTSLSTLPLEDSYFDEYAEVIVPIESEVIITAAGHTHGSMGLWLLSLPFLAGLFRRFRS